MKPSHLERLAQGLPADMQASFLEATNGYSSDGNDPVEAFFSALNEARRRDTETILKKFAADDAWKSQLREQLAKDRAESAKNLKQEIGKVTGAKPWRRGIIKSIVNGIVWVISVLAATTVVQYSRQKSEIDPMKQIIADHRQILKTLSDDPASLMEYAKYTKEANTEALHTATSLQIISNLMTIPKMQFIRSDDGFLTIYADASMMPVGTTKDGMNWFKLGNIQAMMRADTTLNIDKATEAKKKLEKK